MSFCPPYTSPHISVKKDILPLEKALAALLSCARPTDQPLSLPLLEACGRVSAADLYASLPQPPFDRAQVDGYALHSADIALASPDSPVTLPVVQYLYAGGGPGEPLLPGQAARITTGAMMPPGADCVMWQEDTRVDGCDVIIAHKLSPGRNCRSLGHDVAVGRPLVRRGDVLHSGTLGLLAGQGHTQVCVYGSPTVSMLCTGDELCPPGTSLPKGGIYNISGTLLGVRLQKLGASIPSIKTCPDNYDRLRHHLETMLGHSHLIITTGGVSWGPRDLISRLTEELAAHHGGRLLFRGLHMKPGAMTLGAAAGGSVLLGLSGNPVAAAAAFELLAGPLIRKISGRARYGLQRQRGVMRNDFGSCRKDARRLMMARLEGTEVFMRPESESIGQPALWDDCNCFVDIPAGCPPLRRGMEVDVILA
ncbi:MAG: molybdopterin molybdotransferase MoeA [Desulfovibrio sp.]|nr:molybdopterin molybdotransferase MoeA [Desulfovibrio sp.]